MLRFAPFRPAGSPFSEVTSPSVGEKPKCAEVAGMKVQRFGAANSSLFIFHSSLKKPPYFFWPASSVDAAGAAGLGDSMPTSSMVNTSALKGSIFPALREP